jgi:predicted nucleic acid-binding Zn ribbon protein
MEAPSPSGGSSAEPSTRGEHPRHIAVDPRRPRPAVPPLTLPSETAKFQSSIVLTPHPLESLNRRRGSRSDRPQPIGELVPGILERSGIAAKVEAASVIPEWERLVGPGIAAVAHAQKVSDGVLFVAVATSAWLMELNLMKSELLKRLNAGKRAGRIEQIVFVLAG